MGSVCGTVPKAKSTLVSPSTCRHLRTFLTGTTSARAAQFPDDCPYAAINDTGSWGKADAAARRRQARRVRGRRVGDSARICRVRMVLRVARVPRAFSALRVFSVLSVVRVLRLRVLRLQRPGGRQRVRPLVLRLPVSRVANLQKIAIVASWKNMTKYGRAYGKSLPSLGSKYRHHC